MKLFFLLKVWAAVILINMFWVGFPVHAGDKSLNGEPPLNEAKEVHILPNRQVNFLYDRDKDGNLDYSVHHSLVAYIPKPAPCTDYDSRYVLVPLEGAYLIEKKGRVQALKTDPVLTPRLNPHPYPPFIDLGGNDQ